MALARWEPFRAMEILREEMERMLEEPFFRPVRERVGLIPLDMYETDNDLVVKASLPGFRPEDIQVNLTGNTLSIRGERKEEREAKEENYYRREMRRGRFHREVTLPFAVQPDQAQANYENGVLTLRLPKAAEVRGKEIKITAGKA